MATFQLRKRASAGFLTPILLVACTGCSLFNYPLVDSCNMRAYIDNDVQHYISTRYPKDAPVRVAVIPFSVPANLAARSSELPGLGNEIAWRIKNELLSVSTFPIVEVLNRQDWPRKKEEFHTGNFGAIAQARAAGYDMVLVGKLEPLRSLDRFESEVKLIEVETGITVWSGGIDAATERDDMNKTLAYYRMTKRTPNRIHSDRLVNELATCVKKGLAERDILG